jgi:hypothetical protein
MAVTYSPTTPVVGDTVTFTVTVTVNGTTVSVPVADVQLTTAPANSALVIGDPLLDAAGEPALEFDPDVPGAFTFSLSRYTENPVAPTFDGSVDPYEYATEVETFTVNVGVAQELPIVTSIGSMSLRIVTQGTVVASASLVDPVGERALFATLDATVVAKLGSLEGELVAAIGPALPARVGALGTAMAAHFLNTTAHPTGGGYTQDLVNTYVRTAPFDQADAISQLNEIRAAFLAHALGSTTSGQPWHNSADDTKNVPIAQVATTVAGAVVLYADMWRCYDAHRVQTASPASHVGADVTNTLAAVDLLSDLIKTVLVYLADDTPTVPAAQNQAQVEAAALYGFQEA